MDLSTYYQEYESTYHAGNFMIIFALFVTIFMCVRRYRDTKCRWKRILFYLGYLLMFLIILDVYIKGACLCKKDIDNQTIYGYEGDFEILEVDDRLYKKALFVINGEEHRLEYFEDDEYDIDIIKPGKYNGKIVYAIYGNEVLYIEIYEAEE